MQLSRKDTSKGSLLTLSPAKPLSGYNNLEKRSEIKRKSVLRRFKSFKKPKSILKYKNTVDTNKEVSNEPVQVNVLSMVEFDAPDSSEHT